jgi:hypothetical protein
MIPLITRRSSTRGFPRVPVGKCGAIFSNCSSVSQNKSRFVPASFRRLRLLTNLEGLSKRARFTERHSSDREHTGIKTPRFLGRSIIIAQPDAHGDEL